MGSRGNRSGHGSIQRRVDKALSERPAFPDQGWFMKSHLRGETVIPVKSFDWTAYRDRFKIRRANKENR